MEKAKQGPVSSGCSIRVVLSFGSPGEAKMVLEAAKPDLWRRFRRSRAAVALKGRKLAISIRAQDLTALRASFNSLMKSVVVSDNILKDFG